MLRHARLIVASGLVLGFAAAMPIHFFPVFPSHGKALSSTYNVWNHPGASDYLTCGWHDTCLTGSVQSGWALDWGGNTSVYWRSYSVNNAGVSQAGYGTIISYGGYCDDTRVRVYDNGANYQGEIRYLHTYTNYNNYNFAIYSGTGWPDWTSFYIGYTAYEANCAVWTNYHLHQQRWDGSWVKRNYPDVSTCDIDDPDHDEDCGTYDIFAYDMLYRDWVY